MNIRTLVMVPAIIGLGMMSSSPATGDEKSVALPAPQMTGGKPLMEALKERRSTREFKKDAIPMDALSNLLWAAAGVNRDNPDYRTAPSTRNSNAIELYVVDEKAVYLYEPVGHRLKKVMNGDLRAATGMQEFVGKAPVNLVFVADYSKYPANMTDEEKRIFASADAGFMGQNVYLYCASAGLGCVFRGGLDKDALSGQLRLPLHKKVIYAQTIGYPVKGS